MLVRSSTLCLRLFGPFQALVHGGPLPKTRTRKEIWLLALHTDAPLERSWPVGMLAKTAGIAGGDLDLARAKALSVTGPWPTDRATSQPPAPCTRKA